jgi:hypothetical protein
VTIELELTTELDAVNAILASVGESPITTLENAFVDAEMARDLLRQRLRACQLQGWTFNTDTNVALTPDNLGIIYLPPTTLKYTFEDTNLVVRGGKLYDRSKQTYTFTASVTALTLVSLIAFEDCPEAMRLFTTIQAGRRFQDRYQGDQSLHQFQGRDEVSAWASLLNYEADVAQWNVHNNNALIARMKGGR